LQSQPPQPEGEAHRRLDPGGERSLAHSAGGGVEA
jgi:hypothetical protein